MKRIQLTRLLRPLLGAVLATVAITLGAVLAAISISGPSDNAEAVSSANGWGGEALQTLHTNVAQFSPISLANACGLGASSCFKCHNGQRAAAPSMESATAPWHADHKSVNNSCSGCHQGNPRLMKEDMAHKGMLNDPRTDVAAGCVSCHKGGDSETLNKKYTAITK
ncbi:MAG: hypothetical protein ACFCUJ_01095 [Thiotrichales bacterium]